MDFFEQRQRKAERNFSDPSCRKAVKDWHDASRRFDYQYMFEWLGRPIIQDPQDACAIQEVIWRIQPDLIIETGIAHGGSLILSASILAAISQGERLAGNPVKERRVIGIDIEIRAHNRQALECHPLFPMIKLIEGSSINDAVLNLVRIEAADFSNILVFLDSNHTRDHVFEELVRYAPFVSKGSAIFVFDTGIEFAPVESFSVQRPWGPGNSPLTAVNEFLATPMGADFCKDRSIEKRMLLTCAPEGLLVRK